MEKDKSLPYKFQIFELESQKTYEPDRYDLKSIENYSLKQENFLYDYFDTFIEALNELKKWSERNKRKNFVILPVVRINYDGEFEE